MNDASQLDVGDDLEVLRVTRRSAGGSWVRGTLAGHSFEALVFPEHADCSEWEIGDSPRFQVIGKTGKPDDF